MVQSLSWEANWFAASQEIPRISRNPKVHYRTHKSPPTIPILGLPIPVHIPTSHLLEIHPNIIHPSTPRSPQWSLSLRFPHQDSIHPPPLIHTRHMRHSQLSGQSNIYINQGLIIQTATRFGRNRLSLGDCLTNKRVYKIFIYFVPFNPYPANVENMVSS